METTATMPTPPPAAVRLHAVASRGPPTALRRRRPGRQCDAVDTYRERVDDPAALPSAPDAPLRPSGTKSRQGLLNVSSSTRADVESLSVDTSKKILYSLVLPVIRALQGKAASM